MNKKFLLLGVFSFALFSCNNSSSPYTTKAKIEIPAKVAPTFKAGKALKDAVNK